MSAEIDPRLVERLGREPRRVGRAPDLSQSLEQCSKQFQLWDVDREEYDLTPARLERLERLARIRPLEARGPGFEAIASDCTREVVRLVPASTLARKGFAAFRALRNALLRQPYKAGDPGE